MSDKDQISVDPLNAVTALSDAQGLSDVGNESGISLNNFIPKLSAGNAAGSAAASTIADDKKESANGCL